MIFELSSTESFVIKKGDKTYDVVSLLNSLPEPEQSIASIYPTLPTEAHVGCTVTMTSDVTLQDIVDHMTVVATDNTTFTKTLSGSYVYLKQSGSSAFSCQISGNVITITDASAGHSGLGIKSVTWN